MFNIDEGCSETISAMTAKNSTTQKNISPISPFKNKSWDISTNTLQTDASTRIGIIHGIELTSRAFQEDLTTIGEENEDSSSLELPLKTDGQREGEKCTEIRYAKHISTRESTGNGKILFRRSCIKQALLDIYENTNTHSEEKLEDTEKPINIIPCPINKMNCKNEIFKQVNVLHDQNSSKVYERSQNSTRATSLKSNLIRDELAALRNQHLAKSLRDVLLGAQQSNKSTPLSGGDDFLMNQSRQIKEWKKRKEESIKNLTNYGRHKRPTTRTSGDEVELAAIRNQHLATSFRKDLLGTKQGNKYASLQGGDAFFMRQSQQIKEWKKKKEETLKNLNNYGKEHSNSVTRTSGDEDELSALRKQRLATSLRKDFVGTEHSDKSVPIPESQKIKVWKKRKEIMLNELTMKQRKYILSSKSSECCLPSTFGCLPPPAFRTSGNSEIDPFFIHQKSMQEEWRQKRCDSIAFLHNYRGYCNDNGEEIDSEEWTSSLQESFMLENDGEYLLDELYMCKRIEAQDILEIDVGKREQNVRTSKLSIESLEDEMKGSGKPRTVIEKLKANELKVDKNMINDECKIDIENNTNDGSTKTCEVLSLDQLDKQLDNALKDDKVHLTENDHIPNTLEQIGNRHVVSSDRSRDNSEIKRRVSKIVPPKAFIIMNLNLCEPRKDPKGEQRINKLVSPNLAKETKLFPDRLKRAPKTRQRISRIVPPRSRNLMRVIPETKSVTSEIVSLRSADGEKSYSSSSSVGKNLFDKNSSYSCHLVDKVATSKSAENDIPERKGSLIQEICFPKGKFCTPVRRDRLFSMKTSNLQSSKNANSRRGKCCTKPESVSPVRSGRYFALNLAGQNQLDSCGKNSFANHSYLSHLKIDYSPDATVPIYRQPVDNKVNTCDKKWIVDLHGSRTGCERCLRLASEEDRKRFDEVGHHYRICRVRGGCTRDCKLFPRAINEQPVRLCRKCFYDTHHLGKV